MKSHHLALIAAPIIALGACSQSGPKITMTGNGGAAGSDQSGSGGDTGSGGDMGSGGSGVDAAPGGSTGTGGGGNLIDTVTGMPNDSGDILKSSWFMFPCYSQQAQDCITNPPGTQCPNQNTSLPFEQQGLSFSETFNIGGTPGAMYMMTVQVNGITESKYYMGGTRADGEDPPANPEPTTGGNNMFYTGGTPVNVENYNVYKITVFDNSATPVEIQHYYLNSAPSNGTARTWENHNTFPESYTAQIPIMGGGTVVYFESDRNCHAIDNCGGNFAGSSSTCPVANGRMIPNEADVTIPTMWQGKSVASLNTRNGAMQPFHAQIMHVTVTDVSPM
jgi:hypothetical protein